jgi:hypothetical protein
MSDMNVIPRSITNTAVYPPVASSTLLDKVAIKDATVTLNVINAMLLEKCFMP